MLNAARADIGSLCLPCVGADVSEAILFIYHYTASSTAKYFSDIPPEMFPDPLLGYA